MRILELLHKISERSDCTLLPPTGLPTLPNDYLLPQDVIEFYNVAGGAQLFSGKDYNFDIVQPNEFVRANPVIVSEECEFDKSYHWFIIAKEPPQYITIDLTPDNLGRCYDSFWDRHGLRGDCAIVAKTFTDLVECLLYSEGNSLFWLEDSFIYLGDAYD